MSRFTPQAIWADTRMRWSVTALLAVLLVIGATAGVLAHFRAGSPSAAAVADKPSTCSDAYRLLKLRPSEISAANPVCLTQSLQLTGEVVGSVGEAYTVDPNGVAPTAMCSVPKRWDNFPQAMLALVAGGKAYRLRISVPGTSEHQALRLENLANVVELASISDPSQDWSQVTGTLNVNPDGVTGSLNADLLRDVSGARPVHLSGQWACGAPLPLATYDTTVPCASFYTLNQFATDDVARMKSAACNAQDLSFNGDVSAHVDHAITDRATSGAYGYAGDNQCGQVNDQYEATLKFTIGDESFLLDLGASQYPSVTPGQYTAETGIWIGVLLFLGHADPSNHGLFVADDHVFWIGSGGSFTVARDMKSGTIDATVMGATNSSSVQIKGSWRCAP